MDQRNLPKEARKIYTNDLAKLAELERIASMNPEGQQNLLSSG
jgi:hypothetical protein